MMIDFEARRIIEALRSGVPSVAVGQYFSSARSDLLEKIEDSIDHVADEHTTDAMITAGKYGEGKTHLLNTVFNMAHRKNMVVSMVPLSKETPFDKLYLVYQKLIGNTFLPRRLQPGFESELEKMSASSAVASSLLEYVGNHLETKKLFYVLKSYLGTENYEEKFMLLADLEGDFAINSAVKKIYKRIYSEKAKEAVSFSKTKNMDDYFCFMSRLFLELGYNGWVILFDEAELIGRLGKKARLNAYKNMASFLLPGKMSGLKSTYTMFALGASFVEDVIESKHEFDNLEASFMDIGDKKVIKKVLQSIVGAEQLKPLSRDEIFEVMDKLKTFHGKAYGWQPDIDLQQILNKTENSGYLLRTRIRATVEYLDQLYQYGQTFGVKINDIKQMTYDEEPPSLDELL